MDRLGNVLYRWRIRTVHPHISGAQLDLACGTNELINAYGSGVGVDGIRPVRSTWPSRTPRACPLTTELSTRSRSWLR
jgi:hypothetical protein